MNQAELFLSSIKSKETREHYSHFLQKFIQFVGNDWWLSNNQTNRKEIENKIIEFIMQLKQEGKSHAAISNYLAPIKLFYQINDVVLNVKKIDRFMPEQKKRRKDRAYPQKDDDNRSIKGTGALYYYTDIYRIRRQDGSEYLYTKGKVHAHNSLGDPIDHFISKPESWSKVNFLYKTEYNDKTKQMEKVLQGPCGAEEIYSLPFTKENLKSLYDNRQNDLLGLAVKDEPTGKAYQVKDVTGNVTNSYELLRDKSFDYLVGAEFIPKEIKAELRQEAVAQGIIHGGAGDFNTQPPPPTATTAKNTYQ